MAATVKNFTIAIHYVAAIRPTNLKSVLGLDIGGANLKAADGQGWAHSVPFALWRAPGQLAAALAELVSCSPAVDLLAVTMTGELCDCFPTKAEGVRQIISAAEQAAAGRPLQLYLIDGRLVSADEAREVPHLAAASNWHALARFACRYLRGDAGLLVDIGSTTADIVPLVAGRPRPRAVDDTGRLACGELVYTGVGRTPICAVVRHLPWRGGQCPVAAELFATTADAYVALGELPEDPSATWTADGRPLTVEFSRARLARMLCADTAQFTWEDALAAARHIRSEQLAQLSVALRQATEARQPGPTSFVLGGQGEFLAREALAATAADGEVVSLADELGPEVSRCAPAHALAVLAEEAVRC